MFVFLKFGDPISDLMKLASIDHRSKSTIDRRSIRSAIDGSSLPYINYLVDDLIVKFCCFCQTYLILSTTDFL